MSEMKKLKLARDIMRECPVHRGVVPPRADFLAVALVLEDGPRRRAELKHLLRLTQNKLHFLVAAMVRADLVTIEPDPTDARCKIIALTPKAQRMRRRARKNPRRE